MPENPAVRRLHAAVRQIAEQVGDRQPTGRSHDDADDTTGTIDSDGAIGFDPVPLLRAFDRHGARAVVIGQVAGILHGSRELTGDLDVLWDGAPENAGPFAAAFAEVGAELTDDNGAPLPCTRESLLAPKVLFAAQGASGDCCTPALPWGDLPVADFVERCETVRSEEGWALHFLRVDDLIRMRRAVGRPKDLRRAEELVRLAQA